MRHSHSLCSIRALTLRLLPGIMRAAMNTRPLRPLLFLLTWLLLTLLRLQAAPLGTAFTYQGRLSDNGAAADGLYDFTVKLHASATGGTALGTVNVPAVPVTEGIFTLSLDFGAAAFDGSARWLEIILRKQGDSGEPAVLSPRQEITPAPYALVAKTVCDGAITSAKLAPGAVGTSQLAAGSITPDKLAPGSAAVNLAQSGQSGVARGGVVLSPSANAVDLMAAGYFQAGKVNLIPEGWTQHADAPDAATPLSADAKAVWTGSQYIAWGGGTNTGARYNPVTNTWTIMSTTGAPAARSGHCMVWTGTEVIVWGGTNGTDTLNTGGRYNPATNTWTALSTTGAPAARVNAPAVWTGSEMIVWGGGNEEELSTGARYNPATNTWQPMAASGAPSARFGHSLVWTGTRVIVWGGGVHATHPEYFFPVHGDLNDGGSYNPVTNSWTPVTGGPGCIGHAAVWTGGDMIITGGYSGMSLALNFSNTKAPVFACARYNPATAAWTALNADQDTVSRYNHTAVWTGSKMIIWGGSGLVFFGFIGGVYYEGPSSSGAIYSPPTDSWAALPDAGAPPARSGHSAAWTGTQMLISGGGQAKGGRYDAAGNTWSALTLGERAVRTGGTIVWTGSEALVWGGVDDAGITLQNGLRFQPLTNTWTPMSSQGAPSARRRHTAVWTGSRMIVWGGRNDTSLFNDGAAYDPVTDTWTTLNSIAAPSRREQHGALWTGSEMLIWGGVNGGAMQQTGARYDPATSIWTPIRSTGAPTGRLGFAFVWTGSEAVLWGGDFRGTPLSSGGRYSPASDSWQPTSLANAPPGRYAPTGTWTGSSIIFCGGGNAADGYPATHGSYNPATDTWTTLPEASGMGGRAGHCAVWNGSQLIIYGGVNENGLRTYHCLYSPELNAWTPVNSSLPGTPSNRRDALGIWAGNSLLIHGGTTVLGPGRDTWCYTPSATFYLYQRP